MSYYFSKRLAGSLDQAVERTRHALEAAGFDIVNEIDVAETLKRKLGIAFRGYRILGACHAVLAYEALGIEDKVGMLLPCSVIVQEAGDGIAEVAAIDPVSSMQILDNPELARPANQVRELLKDVVERL